MRTFFEKYAFYFCLKIICLEVLAISKQELQINEEIRDREILVIDQNGTKLIAALQKLLCLIYLCFKVVGIDCRKHPDFLDGNHFLILFCFLFPLLLFKAILAVVHNPADRRGCLRGGDKLKVSVRFRKRAIAHPQLGEELLNRFKEACAAVGTVEKPAKMEGRSMVMFISPKASK